MYGTPSKRALDFWLVGHPLVTVAECDFDFACDLAVLTGDNQFDSSEMILREPVVENLENSIDTAVEFSFIGLGIVRAAHVIWLDGAVVVRAAGAS